MRRFRRTPYNDRVLAATAATVRPAACSRAATRASSAAKCSANCKRGRGCARAGAAGVAGAAHAAAGHARRGDPSRVRGREPDPRRVPPQRRAPVAVSDGRVRAGHPLPGRGDCGDWQNVGFLLRRHTCRTTSVTATRRAPSTPAGIPNASTAWSTRRSFMPRRCSPARWRSGRRGSAAHGRHARHVLRPLRHADHARARGGALRAGRRPSVRGLSVGPRGLHRRAAVVSVGGRPSAWSPTASTARRGTSPCAF